MKFSNTMDGRPRLADLPRFDYPYRVGVLSYQEVDMKITPQHEQFGLPHKDAAAIPPESEVADLLRGHHISSGTMRRDDEGGFED